MLTELPECGIIINMVFLQTHLILKKMVIQTHSYAHSSNLTLKRVNLD